MKDKLSKLKNVFKKYGMLGTIKKINKYLKSKYIYKIDFLTSIKIILFKEKYGEEISKILQWDYERIIIWRSCFGYNVPLFQRPQHIANNLSKKGCLVFYEVTTMTDNVKTIKKEKDNLFMVNFNNKKYAKLLLTKLKLINKPKYLQFYSTDWTLSVDDIKQYQRDNYKIIYEYIDDLSPEISGTTSLPKNVITKYDYVMSNRDVFVVTTADLLYGDVVKKRGNKNLIISTNGVDYNFYKNFDKYALEQSYLDIINNGKINICYYGALAKWFDYELIKEIAKTNKYNIILFGVKYDGSYNENISDNTNIYFQGVKEYRILKYYVKKVDILIIPFLINDITKSTSPVKIFEYMALNKPIVTTDMNECRKYKSVLIGKNHEDFLIKLKEATKLINNKKYIDLLDNEAKENDWSNKTNEIIKLIIKDEKKN